MKTNNGDGKVFLHLALLVGLAVAQPLYDQVGANPEFLIAHRLDSIGITGFAVVLSLALPLLLFLVYYLAALVSRVASAGVLGFFLCLLTMLVLLPVLKRTTGLDGIYLLQIALATGVPVTIAYFRSRTFRLFLTVLSFAALVFPLKFLLFSPATQLLGSAPSGIAGDRIRIERNPPVVFLVLDEFPLLSLLNSELEIDAGRYPNQAALAEDAAWYRNGNANSISTLVSVPAMLSGNIPLGRNKGLPSLKNYPDNLFALLGSRYAINATEHGTRLCPEQYCGDHPAFLRLLAEDTLIILGQIYAPPSLAGRLPAINDDWIGFARRAPGDEAEQDTAFFKSTLGWHKRVSNLESFIEGIDGQAGQLHYFHAMLPHSAWRYTPGGRLFTAGTSGHVLGIRPADPALPFKHMWYDSADATRVSRQRHLLQVGFVDRLIGKLVDHLESLGIYDESLLIVTSDHGMSFAPGGPRRDVFDGNLPEVAAVPLFIKYPGNQPAGLSTQNAQLMDILPTILDVLGAQGWTAYDGQSLLDPDREAGREKVVYSDGGRAERVGLAEYERALREQALRFSAEFGEGDYDSVYRAGDQHGLTGRAVTELRVLPGTGPMVTLEHADLLRFTQPDARFLQLVVTGKIDGAPDELPSGTVAISANGVIRSVTGVLDFPNHENSFQVLLPPSAYNDGNNRIETWFVMTDDNGVSLLAALEPRATDYRLSGRTGHWSIHADGTEIAVEPCEVLGWVWVSPAETPDTYTVGGWAADLDAEEPADKVLTFVNGEFHSAISPDRESTNLVKDFRMPGILRSRFGFPLSIPVGTQAAELEIRLFGLSRAGEVSELVYPAGPGEWRFRKNPPTPYCANGNPQLVER